MKLDQLQQKLLAAARAHAPSNRVPHAFEKRIMACLATTSALDDWAMWARALWRAAAPCVAVTLLLAVWSFVGASNNSANPANTGNAAVAGTEDFSQHFEQTMLAGVNEPEEVW